MAIPIKRALFDLFTLGTKKSGLNLISEECSWWASLDQRVIGTVIFDYTDRDYNWVALARDGLGKHRHVKGQGSYKLYRNAERELRIQIEAISRDKDFNGFVLQGDEDQYKPINILEIPPNTEISNLHPYFVELISREGREPARKVIAEISKWLYPKDKNFVLEFQRSQFDQRLWEMYLWATFRELGYDVTQHETPDFECYSPVANFFIEATTITPSKSGILINHPNPHTEAEFKEFIGNYMPMKIGSTLTSKLNKRNAKGAAYWELDMVKGKPFILAIADFHKSGNKDQLGSMVYSQGAFYIYLYGSRINWSIMENGQLYIETAPIDSHNYLGKSIPSGFFDLKDSENISAILFTNAGTLSRFDRMGVCAGFGAKGYKYYRIGQRYDPNPNAFVGIDFFQDVESPEYEEQWHDEIQLFHNPNAKYPISPEWFPDVAQHYFRDGYLYTREPRNRVLTSFTMIIGKETKFGDIAPP